MSDRRASNHYYPPDYNPALGSLNKQQGRSTLKRKSPHSIVVRFALPFTCWCSRCSGLLYKGTRYNAEKFSAGFSLSIQLWEFHFPCTMCKNPCIIRTDPLNTRYNCISGLRMKAGEDIEDAVEEISDEAGGPSALESARRKKTEKLRESEELKLLYQRAARRRSEFDLNERAQALLRQEKSIRAAHRQEALEKRIDVERILPLTEEDEKQLAHYVSLTKSDDFLPVEENFPASSNPLISLIDRVFLQGIPDPALRNAKKKLEIQEKLEKKFLLSSPAAVAKERRASERIRAIKAREEILIQSDEETEKKPRDRRKAGRTKELIVLESSSSEDSDCFIQER